MRACGDQLKMEFLNLLGMVIRANRKFDGPIDSFILRVIDNLDAYRTFYWGRLKFEDDIHSVNHMMKHLMGKPEKTFTFLGFIRRLEVTFILKLNFTCCMIVCLTYSLCRFCV